MKEFNIRIDKMELRSCKDDPAIIAEIILHTEDKPFILAEWKSDGNSHNLSTVPCKLKEEDNFDPNIFVKLLKILTSIIGHLYLKENEALHFSSEGGEGFLQQLGDDLVDEEYGEKNEEEEDDDDDDSL